MQKFQTPMMRQYAQIKKQYEDCLLFFRLGDFYEVFLEDAKIGARVLDIVLTQRPRGKDGHIPMAGVPHHSADAYIAKLTRAGYKVAICEQVSEPNSKGIVDREVVRIVTPGTIMDEKNLKSKEHNYTLSLSLGKNKIGFALADISTGEFQATEASYQSHLKEILNSIITRFNPRECILAPEIYADKNILNVLSQYRKINIYPFTAWENFSQDAQDNLMHHFKLSTLRGIGIHDWQEAQKASAALLGYLKHTQKEKVAHLKTLSKYNQSDYLEMDHATMLNLELFNTLREGNTQGSLINVLDKTSTAMGGRLLRNWLKKPLKDKAQINNRLNIVGELKDNYFLSEYLENTLKRVYDLERILARLTVWQVPRLSDSKD